MRKAVFDHYTTPNNPAGSCVLEMVSGLCKEHSFTVFAAELANCCPDQVKWIPVWTLRRPLALLFITYHTLAPLYFLAFQRRSNQPFDHILTDEGVVAFGDIVYAHFCHRRYLKRYWRHTKMTGLWGALRWLDHQLRALLEPRALRRARWIVVPSHGLARELAEEYPFTRGKVRIIPNPVDTEHFAAPPDFDQHGFRRELNCGTEDMVLAFMALGAFERNGLPRLLEAMAQIRETRLKLVVVARLIWWRHIADEWLA